MEQAMPSSFSSEGGGISVVETLEGGPSWSLSLERLAVSESSFFVGSAAGNTKPFAYHEQVSHAYTF